MTTHTPPRVPMSSPDLSQAEIDAVLSVLGTPDLSMGPWIDRFEAAFRQFSGCSHAIGVNSGTAGLHLLVRAAGIEPGDLAITTPFSSPISAASRRQSFTWFHLSIRVAKGNSLSKL